MKDMVGKRGADCALNELGQHPVCIENVSGMLPEYIGNVSGVFSVCFRIVSGMVGSGMLPECYRSVPECFWGTSVFQIFPNRRLMCEAHLNFWD